MLTLILGRGKTGKTTRLLQEVLRCPARGMAQRIILVPEQLSHQTERTLSAAGDPGISYTSEVLSFTRLYNRVCSLYGGGARKTLDQCGRILTARLALTGIHSRLKVFSAAATRADFLTRVVSMIDEFKSYDVTPRQLQQAARQTEGFFSQKLSELGLILDAYNAITAQSARDPRDKLVFLRDMLRETDYAAQRHFYVDGFTDFSPLELQILEVLLCRGASLTVTVPCDPAHEENPLFLPGLETLNRLRQMAKENGHSVREIPCNYKRPLPESFTYLEAELFHGAGQPHPGSIREVTVAEAGDVLAECRRCAAELKRQAMEGRRWRDLYVAASDTERYGPLMEAVCREYGIPLYTGMKQPVTAQPAAAFVLCALEAVSEGMEPDTVITYLRTGLCGLSVDECDQLENYAYTWSIRGSKWLRPWTEHPDGYDGIFTEETQAILAELNGLRERAVGPLARLASALKSASNTREQIRAVYQLLSDTALYTSIGAQVQAQTEAGLLEEAQETAQVWNTMLECLQQIVSVLGGTAQNAGELLKILRCALGQYQLSTIPATLDAVHFGGIESVRGMHPQMLFVLGANEGLLPAAVSGSSLLTEQERGILQKQMDIRLAPDSEGAVQRQFLQIYSALTAPTEGLAVSYALSPDGDGGMPSPVVHALRRLFPDLTAKSVSESPGDAMSVYAMAAQYYGAEDAAASGLRESVRRTAELVPALDQVISAADSANAPRALAVPTELTRKLFSVPVPLSATKLDVLGHCPLGFFLQYGVRAKPREAESFDPAEFGTFIHYILEKTVPSVTNDAPLTPEESARLVLDQLEPYLSTRMQDTAIMTDRQRFLYRRNGQEATLVLADIAKELSQSRFLPCAFELEFGGKRLPALSVQGSLGSGLLKGTVDRVDLWRAPEGDYFRIIDYKSGKKTFDFTDIYHGVGMQLLLYLFTLRQKGIAGISEQPQAAGAIYYPARRDVVTAKSFARYANLEKQKNAGKQTGIVLDQAEILSAMESGSGEYPSPVEHADKLSERQIDLLETFVEKRIGQAVDQIYGGDFTPSPFYRGPSGDPCTYCDYHDVCQLDQAGKRAFYQPGMKAKEFWEEIGGEEDG